MRVRTFAGGMILTLLLVTVSSCGGEESADNDEPTASTAAETTATADGATATAGSSSAATATSAGGAEAGSGQSAAQGTMELGDQVHELDAPSCSLPEQEGGPLRITADTSDGQGSLLVVGVGGLSSATIEYDGVSYRSPGVQAVIDGSAVSYTGRASSGPLASDTVNFAFSVMCP